jgi:baseplate J-like protein
MTIPSKTFPQFTGDMTTQWGAAIGQVPSLSPGSMLLSIFESVAAQLDFLQAVAQAITLLSRASTSVGSDLDTWMADFNFPRLPATFAVGPVVLLRNSPAPAVVGVQAATLNSSGVYIGGGLVQTTGGAIVYQLIPDTAQAAYNAVSNTYQFSIGSTAITATAQALVAGASYNVSAGPPGLSQLGSQMAGVDSVENLVPIDDGSDAEPDPAFRARFILYLSTLARGTKAAILAAAAVQQGLNQATQENVLTGGQIQLGSFTVFTDDGTGAPPASLLTTVYGAIDRVRAFSVQPFSVGPNILNALISLSVRLAPNILLGTVQALIQAAVAEAVSNLNTNDTLFVQTVNSAAMTVAGVVAVQPGTTINGLASDLVPAPSFEIRSGVNSISVGQY